VPSSNLLAWCRIELSRFKREGSSGCGLAAFPEERLQLGQECVFHVHVLPLAHSVQGYLRRERTKKFYSQGLGRYSIHITYTYHSPAAIC
jgi:hypothetical protein